MDKDKRLKLQTMLESYCPNVYFQAPPSVRMSYPAIRFKRTKIKSNNANNAVYTRHLAYEIIVIDADPDSTIAEEISKIPKISFGNNYRANNLNHDVFTLTL